MTTLASKMKLIPTHPAVDLDGTPWPNCDHHSHPENKQQLAFIIGLGNAMIAAGIPESLVSAGEIVDTTWGCDGNTRLKTRKAFISSVEVVAMRHPQSMFYLPQLTYCAWHLAKDGTPVRRAGGMALTDFTCPSGEWKLVGRDWLYPTFHLEWISPNTGELQSMPGYGVHIINPK